VEFVNVSSQQELDKAIANGDVPVCREGFYSLSGNATARLSGNATARLSGNATARLSGNATAELSGNATAELSGNATARLSGNATARLSGNATAHGSKYTAIHRLAKTTKATGGGVVIEVPEITTMEQFFDYYGVDVKRGKATVYKIVDGEWSTGRGVIYAPGSKPSCGDWSATPCCGGGLHFSPRPFMARKYGDGSRFVACEIKLADAVVITDGGQPDKVKAKACKVLFECDEDGEPVAEAVAA
jgi:hypothetical protein